jgi:hypothetical protein
MSNQKEHPEWRVQNSLTSPGDRESDSLNLNQSAPELTDEQTVEAMKQLNNTSFTERFPEVERRYADPVLDLQKIGLISFVPSKGSKPDEKGIYGFAKLRGNFATETEANARAEELIRKVDSYHQIYHTYVGRPFPITDSSDFSKEVSRIDLKQQITKAISEDVKARREKEQREIEEIKEREQRLLEDVKKEREDLDDHYTTLRVKKAQLTWTYSEYTKKLKEMVVLIAKARREIEDMDKEDPTLKETYYNKYVEARRQSGLPTDRNSTDQSFMKYLVEDLVLPEVDEEYRRLYEQ